MEGNLGIPDSWQKRRIREVGEVVTGRTPSTKREDFYGGDYNLISPADLDKGKYVVTAHKQLTEIGFMECRALPKNSVLVGCIGNVGKLGMVSNDRSATNQQINAIICDKNYDSHFVYYCLQGNRAKLEMAADKTTLPILNKTKFENFEIATPPLAEQRKIAGVLGLVQRAIEQQERLIALTTELKKTLLHKLFTEGLRGEPQKQTDIGPIPQSWELRPCEDLCEMITVGVVVKPASHYVKIGVPAFRSMNVREDRLDVTNLVYFSQKTNDTILAKSKLRTGDVLIVRTGYPGTSCVVPEKFEGANCIDLVIARPLYKVIQSGFLSRFFNSEAGKRQAVSAKHGLAQQHLNVGAVKRTLIPVPPLDEQQEMDHSLATVERKITLHARKHVALTSLFCTLLHQLMTAQVRIDKLDIEELIVGTS